MVNAYVKKLQQVNSLLTDDKDNQSWNSFNPYDWTDEMLCNKICFNILKTTVCYFYIGNFLFRSLLYDIM